ncbi:MAG: 1,4-alpha-glucan branching protein [Actinobacteria bacterium]|nr:1,4-alpha-glucan branching protein [Actinomycetota bacterium]
MAIIHDTTMSPGKLELLRAWLPGQPWFLGTGREPVLSRAGGFRLDDPQGAVGIEFMVVTDASGDPASTYQVPLTYRGHALASAAGALIGTAEHGVLGPRWIYDGVHDPVLVAQLAALIQGDAEPQAQSVTDTRDPTVTSQRVTDGAVTVTGSAVTASGPSGTDLRIGTAGADGLPGGDLTVRIHRILRPAGDAGPGGGAVPGDGAGAGRPCISATWRLPDGTLARGSFASARYDQARAARP